MRELLKYEKIIKFIDINTLPPIKTTIGDIVNIDTKKTMLLYFAKDNLTCNSLECYELTLNFSRLDLYEFSFYLFDLYKDLGFDIKHKWILYFCCIYGDNRVVEACLSAVLKHYKKRVKFVNEIMCALTLNSSRNVLFQINDINNNHKSKTLKKAAFSALKYKAEFLNITVDELKDSLIPNFNFDDDMKLTYDYGNRKIYVFLTNLLGFQIKDETGKIYKTLPRHRKDDDIYLVENNTKHFNDMKSKIKENTKTQTKRLELIMINSKSYSTQNFIDIFINNPIMHIFATSLVWGEYDNNKLISTFRFMEDGTFTDNQENEFILKDNMLIKIVHPLELDEISINSWNIHFDDFEIIQPFNQLNRPTKLITNDEKISNKGLFDSSIIYDAKSVEKILLKLGFFMSNIDYKKCSYDQFYTYYEYFDLHLELNFSGFIDSNHCTLFNIEFFKKDKKTRINIPITDIHPNLFSEYMSICEKFDKV